MDSEQQTKTVYQIVDRRNGEICYVGQGDMKLRIQRHLKRIKELESFTKCYLYLAFIGSENLEFQIIQEHVSRNQAQLMERVLLKSIKPKANQNGKC